MDRKLGTHALARSNPQLRPGLHFDVPTSIGRDHGSSGHGTDRGADDRAFRAAEYPADRCAYARAASDDRSVTTLRAFTDDLTLVPGLRVYVVAVVPSVATAVSAITTVSSTCAGIRSAYPSGKMMPSNTSTISALP